MDVKITRANSGESVIISVEDRIILQLEENQMTGYFWKYSELDDELFNTESDAYEPSSEKLFGAPGFGR